jgi:hypothetical protein
MFARENAALVMQSLSVLQ